MSKYANITKVENIGKRLMAPILQETTPVSQETGVDFGMSLIISEEGPGLVLGFVRGLIHSDIRHDFLDNSAADGRRRRSLNLILAFLRKLEFLVSLV